MLLELEKKAADFLTTLEFPFSKTNVLLAVSGGADSIALLYVFHALITHEILSCNLHCVHINHQLRTDADSDEEFVTSQAQILKIPITTRQLNIRKYANDKKLSIETAARQLRIENFMAIARANNCNWMATGHQKNDNAETVIHRLLRGTGFRGMAGIWPVRKFDENISFVRPLLCVTRDEIIRYLQKKNLDWHEDSTNVDCAYTRNFIRHKLLPALQKDCNISLTDQLFNLSSSANNIYKEVCKQTDSLWPKVARCDNNKVTLNLNMFSEQFPPVQLELIRRSLASIGCGEAGLTSLHYENILHLTKQNVSRKKIQLPGGFLIQREYYNLVFCWMDLSSHRTNESQPEIIKIPGQTTFDNFTIQASITVAGSEFRVQNRNTWHGHPGHACMGWKPMPQYAEQESFDFYKIKLPLTVRLRKEGDRFVPLGQKGEKKIGKFITDQKVPDEIRSKTLVISDAEKIIWLYPIRISEQIKITPKTRKILQLKITYPEPV